MSEIHPQSDKRMIARLLDYAKPYKKQIVIAVLLNIAVAILLTIRPIFTRIAIDDYMVESNFDGLRNIALLFLVVILMQAFFQFCLTYLMAWIGQHIIFQIRTSLYKQTLNLRMKYFDQNPVGQIVTRVTNDINALNDMFSSGIIMIISDILIIVFLLICMFCMNIPLSLVTLSILPPLLIISFIFRSKARKAFQDTRKHLGRMNGFMQEHVLGMLIVKIFNREKKEMAAFADINKDYRGANIRTIFYYALYFPAVELLSSITMGLIIWYSAGAEFQNAVSPGMLIMFIQFTEMFFRPIYDLSDKYNLLQNAMAASERIFELMDNDEIIENPQNPEPLNVSSKIEFRNVYFAYNDDDYVLKDFSLTVNPGETIAIVGATGAGKTTITSLLNRFYEINQGEICIDNIDIRKLDKSELRSAISIVLQNVVLFEGSIKENIRLGNLDISDDEVIAAAQAVGADQFISKLPLQYDSIIFEDGASLSVGQKQLISFARALAYKPQLLILDEATSNIDTETE
ncbi:MAG: ABC transporter ATP-binding protein, partial [Lentisphaeria bacterium]|nr:ABC transporter ATP-binding protein [Lentisphaeria bacterium]